MEFIGYSFCGGTEVWTARPHKDYPQFYMIYRHDEYIMEAPFEGEPTERDIVTIRKAFYAGIQRANRIWPEYLNGEEKEGKAEQEIKIVPDDRAKM